MAHGFRGGRPRRVQRPGGGRPVRCGHAGTGRGAPVPERTADLRRHDALEHPAAVQGTRSTACARRSNGTVRCPGSASTPGRWTTGCSTLTVALLGNPVHYRDSRTARGFPRCTPGSALAPLRDDRHPAPAVQHGFPAGRRPDLSSGARSVLLVPDLLSLLADRRDGHRTDQRVHHRPARPAHRHWSVELFSELGLRPRALPAAAGPGCRGGCDLDERLARSTRSARTTRLRRSSRCPPPVTGSPTFRAEHGHWSASSCDAPVLTDGARAANFTNELGVDGTVRFLRNVMGLWLLQECAAGSRAEPRLPARSRDQRGSAAQRRRRDRPALPAAGRDGRADHRGLPGDRSAGTARPR